MPDNFDTISNIANKYTDKSCSLLKPVRDFIRYTSIMNSITVVILLIGNITHFGHFEKSNYPAIYLCIFLMIDMHIYK